MLTFTLAAVAAAATGGGGGFLLICDDDERMARIMGIVVDENRKPENYTKNTGKYRTIP